MIWQYVLLDIMIYNVDIIGRGPPGGAATSLYRRQNGAPKRQLSRSPRHTCTRPHPPPKRCTSFFHRTNCYKKKIHRTNCFPGSEPTRFSAVLIPRYTKIIQKHEETTRLSNGSLTSQMQVQGAHTSISLQPIPRIWTVNRFIAVLIPRVRFVLQCSIPWLVWQNVALYSILSFQIGRDHSFSPERGDFLFSFDNIFCSQ